ncbi:hypothetical protein [Spirosoma pomorum]
MWIDFDKLPDDARVWVYQANRPLTDADVQVIEQTLQPALNQWAAHGQPLLASAQVVANRFVVVGVDEGYSLPSGCSIDSSARTIRDLGQQLAGGVDFFDRSAAILNPDGSVTTYPLAIIKKAVTEGRIMSDSILLNTLVKTKAEFLSAWQQPASESWLKRYFKVATTI